MLVLVQHELFRRHNSMLVLVQPEWFWQHNPRHLLFTLKHHYRGHSETRLNKAPIFHAIQDELLEI